MPDLKSLLRMSRGKAVENLPVAIEESQRISRNELVPKLLKFAGKIPFADDLAASWYCANDPETPLKVKAVLMGAVAYFVIPADLIPDVIPLLGFTDDATVLATALGIVGGQIRPDHRRAARRLLQLPEPPPETDSSQKAPDRKPVRSR